jgi:hypothetical protein
MRIFTIFVLASLHLFSSESVEPGTYRHSGGFQEEVIYLTSDIGIVRSVRKEGDGQIRIYYKLGKIEYIGHSESSELTGDAMREPLVSSISEMLWIPQRQIFIGRGFDSERWPKGPDWFIVDGKTGEITFYTDEASFQSARGKLSLSDVKLVPSEWYFRRLVHDYGKDATEK